jgi:uncharacterized protein
MSQENMELVRKGFEAFNVGGIEALLPFYAPDTVWYSLAEWLEDPVYRGHDGARKLIAAWTEGFGDWAWEVHEIRDAGDAVVAFADTVGQIKGSVVPIGQPMGIVFSGFRDGMIGEVRFFLTSQEALDAVGLAE